MRGLADMRANDGFTLVETIVSGVIIAVLVTAVVGMLAFGARWTRHQEQLGNAATLASTVKTTLEGTLRNAKVKTPFTTSGDAITAIDFTTTQETNYLGNAGSDYQLYIENGQLYIQELDDGGNPVSGSSGELLPEPTYIDGDTISLAAVKTSDDTVSDTRVTINVYSAEDTTAPVATTTADIASVSS